MGLESLGLTPELEIEITAALLVPLKQIRWVDTSATAGGTGTLIAPFNTISAALADLAGVGGYIHIAPGTYPENLTIPTGNFVIMCASGVDRMGQFVVLNGAIAITSAGFVSFNGVRVNGPITTSTLQYLILNSFVLGGSIAQTTGQPLKVVAYGPLLSRNDVYSPTNIGGTISIKDRLVLDKCRMNADITCGTLEANDSAFDGIHTLTTTGVGGVNAEVQLRGRCTGFVGWTYTGTTGASFDCQDPGSVHTVRGAGMIVTNVNTIFRAPYAGSQISNTILAGAASALTIDFNVTGAGAQGGPEVITLHLGSSTPLVLTFVPPVFGGRFEFDVVQDGSGNRTITLPAAVRLPAGGLTLSTGINKRDRLGLRWSNGICYLDIIGLGY